MPNVIRRDTLELSLEGVQGGPVWATGRRETQRLITVTLIWPRPLVAARVATRQFAFTKEGLDVADRDWSERVLFKENVEGPFGVVVQVSQSLSSQELARITATIGGALLRAAGAEAASLVSGPGITSLARFPFNFLAGEVSGVGKVPRIEAAGRVTLQPGQGGPIEIPLTVPEDIVRVRSVRSGGRTQSRREITHRKGTAVGTIRLDAVYYRS